VSPSVLIVDDDAVFRALARAMLAGAGFEEIAEAGGVAEARAAVQGKRPDAVLVDVHLPDGDGIALARELGAGSSAPRVLLTSSDSGAGARVGVDFVPKADLIRHLGTTLGRALK
jgi:CheY-like chemotaxis protein